ncbi:MAG: competence/damage-inducible protein A [Oscillospiraceae bacterium]|jgi:nicotinamide-nucleotide amidase|nr:competence/damage-inducible protein A [Oscillospiraceae bacterium]
MTYTAEIISVGTELLLGNIANTDARDVSVALSRLGINVFCHTVVGDNPGRVTDAVNLAKTRADIIITTGGLGPTYDDMTKSAVAAAFGKELVLVEAEAEKIREFFRRRHPDVPMTENNLTQAYLPDGATVFSNGAGTAPGCAFESGGKYVLMLPGPPRECIAMLENEAVPYLKRLSDGEIYSHNIYVFGIGESAVEDALRDVMLAGSNPTLAPYAKDGEVMLRATAKADSEAEAEKMLAPVIGEVLSRLGDKVYGIDTGSLEATVVALLRRKGITVSAAESCTGGLVAKRITDVPGASSVFLGGVIAYTSEVKTRLVGVPAELIRSYGVVSRQVAESLAMRAREKFGSDVGIGVTGAAGPGADADGNPEGTVYISVAARDGVWTRRPLLLYDRARIRHAAASNALDMVRRYLAGLTVAD